MKTLVLSLAYCNSKVFRSGTHSLRETVDFKATNARHVILNQHYPLEPASMDLSIAKYAAQYPSTTLVLDAGKNLGLHHGLNYMLEQLTPGLEDDDIIIGFDLDEAPPAGWLRAMLDVFTGDPSFGWLSLTVPASNEVLEYNGCDKFVINGVRVHSPSYALINTVCAWRWSAIKKVGAFMEPHQWYGGLEVAMMPKFWEHGYRVGWLPDFVTGNHRHYADASYELYKHRHVGHVLPEYPGSFEDWVKERNEQPH